MDSNEIEIMLRLESVFMPYAAARREKIYKENGRFVHYTSAENALRIIQSKQIWMRNARCMTDYMEVSLGYQMLLRFFSQKEKREVFCKSLNRCHPGVGEEALQFFDQWWNNIQFDIYIASISEHDDTEDAHGRLSMWRAFGRLPARAALVIKPPAPGAAEGLRVMLSPVAYFDYDAVEKQIKKVIANVRKNIDFLKTFEKDRIKNMVFFMLVAAAVSLKHQGFQEEREWRVIYIPQVHQSKLIVWSTEIIDGVPQIIHKIPLQDSPDDGVIGVAVPTLLDRVIIGPSPYPVTMGHAFGVALQQAGVANPGSRIVASGIPIRQ
jgi:hypothetical protein